MQTYSFYFSNLVLKSTPYISKFVNRINVDILYRFNKFSFVLSPFYKSSLKTFGFFFGKLFCYGLRYFVLTKDFNLFKTFFCFNRKLMKYMFIHNYFNLNNKVLIRSDVLHEISYFCNRFNIKGMVLCDY